MVFGFILDSVLRPLQNDNTLTNPIHKKVLNNNCNDINVSQNFSSFTQKNSI